MLSIIVIVGWTATIITAAAKTTISQTLSELIIFVFDIFFDGRYIDIGVVCIGFVKVSVRKREQLAYI